MYLGVEVEAGADFTLPVGIDSLSGASFIFLAMPWTQGKATIALPYLKPPSSLLSFSVIVLITSGSSRIALFNGFHPVFADAFRFPSTLPKLHPQAWSTRSRISWRSI